MVTKTTTVSSIKGTHNTKRKSPENVKREKENKVVNLKLLESRLKETPKYNPPIDSRGFKHSTTKLVYAFVYNRLQRSLYKKTK